MLPRFFSGLFLVTVGGGVLAVAWRGHLGGVLPAGPNFLTDRWLPSQKDNPIAFHLFLVLYFGGGTALCVWGLLVLVGLAPPLPLR